MNAIEFGAIVFGALGFNDYLNGDGQSSKNLLSEIMGGIVYVALHAIIGGSIGYIASLV